MGSKYFEIQYDYAKLLLDIVKVLLKSKSQKVKSEIFWFLAVAIYSNQSKWKLSNNLSASFKNKIKGIANDVFCFNLCVILIELCKPFMIKGH